MLLRPSKILFICLLYFQGINKYTDAYIFQSCQQVYESVHFKYTSNYVEKDEDEYMKMYYAVMEYIKIRFK